MEEASLLSTLLWLIIPLLLGLALYVYFAVTVMAIARKTNTPGAAMAWVPILNLVLMCQIARRPGWWVLLLFIPLIGLVAFAVIWMSIAEVCGKSAWIGALAIVPVIGWIVPAFLAIGKNAASNLAFDERICQACGTPIVGDETFCRNCGEAALTIVASKNQAAGPRTSTGQMVLIGGGLGLGVLLISGVFGWLALTSLFAYAAPERQPPAIPERTEGSLTEFPVDTDSDDALAPDSVSTEDLQNPPPGGINETHAKKRLPPGIDRGELKKRGGETLTTTIYRPRRKPEQPTDKEDIYISVVRIKPGNGDKIAVDVAKKTDGKRTGTRVRSPKGETYVGSKIQSPQTLIYVLEKQGSDVLILIYTPNSSMFDATARLAGNVGNGGGLNDYPETRATVWTLPPKPPTDLVLVDFRTTTRAEMGLSQSELDAAGKNEDERKLIEYFSQFIPERITEARYVDAARRDWEVAIYDYDSTGRAWRTWLFLSWTLGLSGESVPLDHGSGIYADTGDGRGLLFQKGPYLIFIKAPTTANTDKLVSFGNGFQL